MAKINKKQNNQKQSNQKQKRSNQKRNKSNSNKQSKPLFNTINPSLIKEWKQDFIDNKSNLLIQNIVSSNSLNDLCINRSVHQSDEQVFERRVSPIFKITDQYSTGTCWIHASLNMIRPFIINKFNLDESFEFSTSYLYFYDRLENVNNFFNCLIQQKNLLANAKTKDEETIIKLKLKSIMDSRMISDGGGYDRFVFLINKYGIVPKSTFKNCFHTSYSWELKSVLVKMCNSYACSILSGNEFNMEIVMKEFFNVLSKFIGIIPDTFDWEYYESKDNDQKYHKYESLTPLSFYNLIKFNFNDFVPIINNPNYAYNKSYYTSELSSLDNDYGNEKFINLDINRILQLIILMINKNIPVWLGCDIAQNLNRNLSLFDNDSSSYDTILGIEHHYISKEHRFKWENQLGLHAMVIVGYNQNSKGLIFECANSWGDDDTYYTGKGYFHLTDLWLNENLYDLVIHKNLLSKEELKIFNSEPNEIDFLNI